MTQTEPSSAAARATCLACRRGSFEDATEIARVPSNVRRWKTHLSTVWRCPACGSLNSLERVDLSVFYADYPFRKRKLDGFTKVIFAGLYRRLRRFGLEHGFSILDYGCSEGLFVEYLKGRGHTEAVGYDAYVDAFADRKILDRQFDFVVAQDLIEHAEDPPLLFAELCSLVRPGGTLYLGTPCADRLPLAQADKYVHSLHQPFHISILSEDAMRTLSKEQQMRVESIEHGHVSDSLVPFVNWAFLRAYLARADDTLDAGFDPPRPASILGSPELIFKAFFGYFLREETEMFIFLRKPPS